MAKIRKSTSPAGRRAKGPLASRPEKDVLNVTVVLLDGGYASTAIGPIEVFHAAGQLWNWLHGDAVQPRFRVRTASVDGRSVTSLYSVGLIPQCAIADIKKTDIVIVPAADWDVQARVAKQSALLPWLRKWHARGAYIAGICSGVGLLAESGLLDGRHATTHWGVCDVLRQRYPKVHWHVEQFVTEDSRVFCSGGVYAAIDLSLYLVEKFCGHEIALQCAKSLLVSMPRSSQSGYAVLPLSRPHTDDKIKQAEVYMQTNYGRDVSIDALAGEVGMSPRNFIRRFKAATGRLPGAYMQTMRVSMAKEMLERDAASVQAICTKIGYDDIAFFRSLFKRHTGMTPAEYRSRFAGMNIDGGELLTG